MFYFHPSEHINTDGMNNDVIQQWQKTFTEWLQQNWLHEDGAHDIEHLHRVWRNCQLINAGEGEQADSLTLLAAAYFHDIVTVPKNDPRRNESSLLSAEKTTVLLRDVFIGFPSENLGGIKHAIHAHSFSANVEPLTPEAKILQDADRLEALGAIGIARLFYTSGKMNAQMFHSTDPSALTRQLDDRQFALDHIELKLLKLPGMMQTATGRKFAEQEAEFIKLFRAKLLAEIG